MSKSDDRLKWYGIEPLEDTEAKKFKDIYGEDCKCKFDLEGHFKCGCDWKEIITLKEHKAFQDLRIISKPGINCQLNMLLIIYTVQTIPKVKYSKIPSKVCLGILYRVNQIFHFTRRNIDINILKSKLQIFHSFHVFVR